MAAQDYDRPVPRELERDRSTPMREEGMGIQDYVLIASILAVIIFVGASLFGATTRQSPINTSTNDRTIVNPPATTTPR